MSSLGVVLGAAEPLYRLGMRMACERAGMHVLAEAEDRPTLTATAALVPGSSVIVSEVRLLEPDAPRLVHELTDLHRVLVVETGSIDRPRLLRAGASGFVRRDADGAVLCHAVAAAGRGDLVVAAGDGMQTAHEPVVQLTQRELDVLRLIASGRSTEAAARELHLSPSTFKTHLRNASAKLGTPSRAAAVARATALGHLS
ncbi:MAG TPA: response regulator transcription factor [Solirubrobacteraceae bacterium]|nr:response regulator transcription factor [Solirubrobacteraceae bacterium]